MCQTVDYSCLHPLRPSPGQQRNHVMGSTHTFAQLSSYDCCCCKGICQHLHIMTQHKMFACTQPCACWLLCCLLMLSCAVACIYGHAAPCHGNTIFGDAAYFVSSQTPGTGVHTAADLPALCCQWHLVLTLYTATWVSTTSILVGAMAVQMAVPPWPNGLAVSVTVAG